MSTHVGRINNHWVNETGDDCPEVLIIFDSQGRKVAPLFTSLPLPEKSRIVSISGGGLREVLVLADRPMFREASTVILAGIGTNDLALRGRPTTTPPTIIGTQPGLHHDVLRYDNVPGTSTQRPGIYAQELKELFRAVFDKLSPTQTLITFDPIPRRSEGFVNRQISFFQSKLEPFGVGHHHVRSLGAFTTTNNKRNKGRFNPDDPNSIFGGRRPAKDSMFDSDNVHLSDAAIRLFVQAIVAAESVVRAIRAGGTPPVKNTRLIPEKSFFWKF